MLTNRFGLQLMVSVLMLSCATSSQIERKGTPIFIAPKGLPDLGNIGSYGLNT